MLALAISGSTFVPLVDFVMWEIIIVTFSYCGLDDHLIDWPKFAKAKSVIEMVS